jgi:hypothetical protein
MINNDFCIGVGAKNWRFFLVCLFCVLIFFPFSAQAFNLNWLNSFFHLGPQEAAVLAADPLIVSFGYTPTPVIIGQSAKIFWSSLNATTCSIPGLSTGGQVSNTVGISTGPLSTPQRYTLICSRGLGSISRSLTIVPSAPIPPPLILFGVSSSTNIFTNVIPIGQTAANTITVYAGTPVFLGWMTTNVVSCISGDFNTGNLVNSDQNGVVVTPMQTQTYKLTCRQDHFIDPLSTPLLTVTKSVTVTVIQPPSPLITSFVASPANPIVGGFSTFTWQSSNTTNCSLPQLGARLPVSNLSGTAVGPINTNTTYTLTCTGLGVATASKTVQVAVTPLPSTICQYATITLKEKKPIAPSTTATFSVESVTSTAEDLAHLVSPYDPDWGSDYKLKTLGASGSTFGSYNLFSGRFAIAENFSPTDPKGEIIETDEALIDTIIPYNSLIKSVQVDSGQNLPVTIPSVCAPLYRLEGQSVDFSLGQQCAPGLSSKEVNNIFVCSR